MCHSHLTVNFRKIRSKKEKKKTFTAIFLIKFQMRNIDKVVELPSFCLKRITPKESDFCLHSGQLFKSYYWSLSTPHALGVNCSRNCAILYKSKETDTGIMSVTMETEQCTSMGKIYISKLNVIYT